MSVSGTHKCPAPTRSFAAEELPQTLHPCHNHITRQYTRPQIHSNRSHFFAKNKVAPGLVLGQLLCERACMIKKLCEPVCDASIALPWEYQRDNFQHSHYGCGVVASRRRTKLPGPLNSIVSPCFQRLQRFCIATGGAGRAGRIGLLHT